MIGKPNNVPMLVNDVAVLVWYKSFS